jgi:preprotein translocase subunit SecB
MDNNMPTVALNMQYIKDLSLEIPHAPQIFSKLNNPPKISVDMNIDAKKIEDTQFEVTLNIRINADVNNEKLFILELSYGSISTITLPEDQIETILFIEIPQLLFPYARQIISSNLSEAGLPPLLLSPVDFVKMYQSKKENQQKAN